MMSKAKEFGKIPLKTCEKKSRSDGFIIFHFKDDLAKIGDERIGVRTEET